MRKLFTVDFAVWELYIGTAPNEKCAVGDFIQTKKKNPSRGFFALRRVVIYYPRYHSNCVHRTPLRTPTSPMLLRSLTGGFYLKIFLPSDSEATNPKLTYRLSPAADSLKSYRFKSSSSPSLNILFVRILTRLFSLVKTLKRNFLQSALFMIFSAAVYAKSSVNLLKEHDSCKLMRKRHFGH